MIMAFTAFPPFSSTSTMASFTTGWDEETMYLSPVTAGFSPWRGTSPPTGVWAERADGKAPPTRPVRATTAARSCEVGWGGPTVRN